jgi:hypothetical protein
MSAPAERTALYRLYDADDRLLYVGISANPEKRWKGHSIYSARWWGQVTAKVIEWHGDRYLALAYEYLTILRERPVHNRRRTPPNTDQWPNEAAAALLNNLPWQQSPYKR